MNSPDLILRNARIATLDPQQPEASAVAIGGGRFLAVGDDDEVMRLSGAATHVIDGRGRRVIPGLIDSHIHVIRGGLNYNLELRWDGLPSLADAMRRLKEQVARTPAPQWVRVVGGFTAHQFAEKRLPTLEELNAVAPDTPVFILHLYDRALLNRAALRAAGYDRNTADPPGGRIERDANGEPTGLLLAAPNALLLYSALARGPKLPYDYQLNSTRHFMREMNRLGVTSVIDAGGGFQNYPDDYQVVQDLHAQGQLTLRIAYNLFTQKPKEELADFTRWSAMVAPGQGDAMYRHNGAGEMLVFSAADFEDFRQPRPDLPPGMEPDLEAVVRLLVEKRWPFRMHATYDETIGRLWTCSRRSTATCRSTDCTGSSTMPKPSATATSNAWRNWAAASRFSIAWRTRANTSSSALDMKRRNARRRSSACSRWACRSARARTPRAWRAMIRGMRSTGWSRARRWAGDASIRRPICSTAQPR